MSIPDYQTVPTRYLFLLENLYFLSIKKAKGLVSFLKAIFIVDRNSDM